MCVCLSLCLKVVGVAEMEALPFSRVFLTTGGIQWSPAPSALTIAWNYFIRTTGVSLQLIMIVFHVYAIVFRDTILVSSMSLAALCTLKLVTYVNLMCKKGNLFRLLDLTLAKLDKKRIRMIRSYDRWHMTLILTYNLATMAVACAYIYQVGVGPEVVAIALATRSRTVHQPVLAVTVVLLFMACITLFALLMQFYVNVLFVALQTASCVKAHVIESVSQSQPDFASVRRHLEWYNSLMSAINADTGILPFALLGMEFIGFTAGTTFLVTSTTYLHTTPYFVLLIAGSFNLMYLYFGYTFIRLSCEARRTMQVAWKVAADAVTDPLSPGTVSDELRKARKALKFFVLTETVVPVMAVESIVIDGSLVLGFVSEVIPFTVMMMTTVKELQQRLDK